ncbi:DUF2855 family protein [Eudoraea chungangensis]|uniref:DUF2855 family protein n=1 Tax=Eudoraea chungangensis TaxID=1481905 RepID=UPI0023EDA44E|nr:DUF2855 family protein [Eudoraea chungangensis]
MTAINAIDFTVQINKLHHLQIVEKVYSEELAPNQVLLEIDRFSFTSNNITYGVVGEQLDYWKFFPTHSGFGIIPAWGLANVVASKHPDIQVGQRFYGYYPMSTHLLVTAKTSKKQGFWDVTEHRNSLPAIYNFYTDTAQDSSYTPETENLISIFRPLFVTSFLIDDFLAEENFYEATQILITSASSKTALALVSLLANRKQKETLNLNLVGLTSKKNIGFVSKLAVYDQILSYEHLADIREFEKTVIIDFTGNHNLQYQLQRLLGNNLIYNCLVGLVDWQNQAGEKELPTKGEFFFAPTQAEIRQKVWGPTEFQQRLGRAWQFFINNIQQIISIKEYIGPESLKVLYLDMLEGKVNPEHGNIVRLSSSSRI